MNLVDLDIANTIRDQIGNKALVMIGASNYVAIKKGIRFNIGKNESQVTHIEVYLNVHDLYDVTFYNCEANQLNVINKIEGVYFAELAEVIEEGTGMRTNL